MTEEDTKVREILPDTPFRMGGGLDIDTGRGAFVPLDMHREFRERVIKNRLRGVSIWALAGPVGIGRTWTLAWIARQAREECLNTQTSSSWDAALVPGVGSGEIRDFYESIFASTEHVRESISAAKNEENSEYIDDVSNGTDDVEIILENAIKDRETWSVLTGDKGRFPSIRGATSKPRWKKRETQIEFLESWLKLIYQYDIENLLILVDEFEKTATRLSSKKLTDFSDGLRRLYDIVDQSQEDMPNTQVILSATPESVNKMDPQASSQNLAGWLRPLQTRMNRPYYLTNIDMEDAMEIAKKSIDYKRTIDVDDPYYPYEESSIKTAFKASNGRTRRFTQILKEMHVMAYDENTINDKIAREAIEHLGYDI